MAVRHIGDAETGASSARSGTPAGSAHRGSALVLATPRWVSCTVSLVGGCAGTTVQIIPEGRFAASSSRI
jgi:hypothetical protein